MYSRFPNYWLSSFIFLCITGYPEISHSEPHIKAENCLSAERPSNGCEFSYEIHPGVLRYTSNDPPLKAPDQVPFCSKRENHLLCYGKFAPPLPPTGGADFEVDFCSRRENHLVCYGKFSAPEPPQSEPWLVGDFCSKPANHLLCYGKFANNNFPSENMELKLSCDTPAERYECLVNRGPAYTEVELSNGSKYDKDDWEQLSDKERLEALKKAEEEARKKAKEEAKKQAEAELKAKEEAKRQAEAVKKAKEEAKKQAEAVRKEKGEAKKQLDDKTKKKIDAKAAEQGDAKDAAASNSGTVVAKVHAHSPPFSKTPLGQKLILAPVTNVANAAPTKNSPLGGYAGFTRSGGHKFHGGLDDPARSPIADDVTHFHGTTDGIVLGVFNSKDLGAGVSIGLLNGDGLWVSTTMHHSEIMVKKGDIVRPGDPIATGAGVGNMSKSSLAGSPHVHWKLVLNGKRVDPLSGIEISKKH